MVLAAVPGVLPELTYYISHHTKAFLQSIAPVDVVVMGCPSTEPRGETLRHGKERKHNQ
jgi:NADH:ubiquinone oxidoreductase subunit B-like Fe-S oxidoreductase